MKTKEKFENLNTKPAELAEKALETVSGGGGQQQRKDLIPAGPANWESSDGITSGLVKDSDDVWLYEGSIDHYDTEK